MEDIITKAVARAVAEQEQKMKDALANTDWDQTAVVHFVQYQPDLARAVAGPDDDVEKADVVGEVKVHRYGDHAPPLDVYADGRRKYNVRTVTKPLLDRIQDDHDVDLPEQSR
jgi:hypothetical protein